MQDEKDNILELVLKQIFIGLLGGFIGMMTFAAVVPPTDLSSDIINALLAGFFTMIATIIIVTILHKRQRRKKNKST